MKSYINDGCTAPFYFAPVRGLHSGLRGKYRPTLIEERNRFLDGVGAMKLEKVAQAEAQHVASRVLEWDLVDGAESPVKVKPVSVLRLAPVLFDRLRNMTLYGTDGGDLDPQNIEGQEKLVEREFESALADAPQADMKQQASEKN